MPKHLDDEVCSLLKTVAQHFEREDEAIRQRQVRRWQRMKYYWNNFSQIYWSESAQSYLVFGRDQGVSEDQAYYDRPINVFRAFLETIIAALSVDVPAISCVPDDATNPLDISTAKAGDQIASLIYKHSNAPLLWIQALYILCTEGLVACYAYPHKSKEYGVVKLPKYEDEEVEMYVCPYCQSQLADFELASRQMSKFMSDGDDVMLDDSIGDDKIPCPECAELLDPNLQKTKLIIPKIVGETTEPKSRISMNMYGGLYVKVANYAKTQAGTPYLRFAYETHYANVLEDYPTLYDKISTGSSGPNVYEQYSRLSPQYRGEHPDNNVTVSHTWLRPAAFNILNEDDSIKLHKLFPNGARVCIVNDTVVDYNAECLDDYWTIAHNPMSDYLIVDPLGELLTNVQDTINDLISLTIQTIEHGIVQTWADPEVVNFDQYGQVEAQPGMLTPTKPVPSNKSLSEAFYSTKQASLSPEVFSFFRIIQELGQFTSGAMPSIFGGQQPGGSSRTASEYAMSRNMALQRLQTVWKMLTLWWKQIFSKVIPMYMSSMIADERFVEKDVTGNYVNIFIRRSDLAGKIGSIELEPSDHMPISDEQQRDVIIQLMQMGNAGIQQALASPENLPFIKKLVRIPQFKVPGEEDRQKQFEEIYELVSSEPIVTTLADGQQQESSSVPIDEVVDNHEVEAAACRSWLISEAGRLAKVERPLGYKNVVLHMKAHTDVLASRAAIALQENSVPEQKPAPVNLGKLVRRESDVRTPIE